MKRICRMMARASIATILSVYSALASAQSSTLITPAPGSTLNSSTVTFSWTEGPGAYQLFVGTENQFSENLYSNANIPAGTTSVEVTGLPSNTIVYAILFTESPAGSGLYFQAEYSFNTDIDGDDIIDSIDQNPSSPASKTVFSGSDYTFTLHGSGRVASLESSARFANTSRDMSYEEITEISRIVYQHMNDEFDFLIIASNQLTAPEGSEYVGLFYDAKNAVGGIGSSIFDDSNSYGSQGKLQGATHLITTGNLIFGPSLHEILHNWANNLESVPTEVAGHWGYSNIGGQLGGWQPNSLESLGNNQYRAKDPASGEIGGWGGFANGGNSLPYSNFELYLMGLIPAEEVGHDIKIANGFQWVNAETGVFSATSITTTPISQVISTDGARTPDNLSSQRTFRALYLILTANPLTSGEWQSVDQDAQRFGLAGNDGTDGIYNFWEATGGRAFLQLDELQDLVKSSEGQTPGSLPIANVNGQSSAASLACQGDAADGVVNIDSSQPLTLACSFNIDPVNVGQSGSSHIVIIAEGQGAFQINEAGAYVPWQGTAESLVPTESLTLSTTLDLTAFNNLIFDGLNIPSAQLTVYLAYAVTGSDTLVYSQNGIRVTVN